MVQSRRSACWGRAGGAFPSVKADVMMITARGEERGLMAEALGHFEAQDIAVEANGSLQVSHLQVHVTDSRFGVDGLSWGVWLHGFPEL